MQKYIAHIMNAFYLKFLFFISIFVKYLYYLGDYIHTKKLKMKEKNYKLPSTTLFHFHFLCIKQSAIKTLKLTLSLIWKENDSLFI